MDDHQIKKLNKKYLRRNKPTDVISFSQMEGEFSHIHIQLLGDVVISVETAKRQAREFHNTLQDEITFLLIHGILHLVGYDHEGSVKNARKMKAKERKLLGALQLSFQS